jgi:hypothetical protein
LYYSYTKVLVDAAVLSEEGIVKKWDFKPGSVERSISKRGISQQVQAAGDVFNVRHQ